MRKKIVGWFTVLGCVTLLLAVINGCSERPLPEPEQPNPTPVTISGAAV